MPGKHHHNDDDRHGKDERPPRGPKERELAVALTVAVLNAAHVSGTLEEVEALALRTFGRMLEGITRGGPNGMPVNRNGTTADAAPLPPTVQF